MVMIPKTVGELKSYLDTFSGEEPVYVDMDALHPHLDNLFYFSVDPAYVEYRYAVIFSPFSKVPDSKLTKAGEKE